MPPWRSVHVGFQDDGLKIGGVEIWKHEWRRTDSEPLILPHPDYPDQRHRYYIYEVGDQDQPECFAVSELSNGVWGFYVPD